jgi:hypothetical protein
MATAVVERRFTPGNICLEVEPRNVDFALASSMCNQRKITLTEFLVD